MVGINTTSLQNETSSEEKFKILKGIGAALDKLANQFNNPTEQQAEKMETNQESLQAASAKASQDAEPFKQLTLKDEKKIDALFEEHVLTPLKNCDEEQKAAFDKLIKSCLHFNQKKKHSAVKGAKYDNDFVDFFKNITSNKGTQSKAVAAIGGLLFLAGAIALLSGGPGIVILPLLIIGFAIMSKGDIKSLLKSVAKLPADALLVVLNEVEFKYNDRHEKKETGKLATELVNTDFKSRLGDIKTEHEKEVSKGNNNSDKENDLDKVSSSEQKSNTNESNETDADNIVIQLK